MMIKRPQPDNKLWQETKIKIMHNLQLESLRNHDDGEETVKKHLIYKQNFLDDRSKTRFMENVDTPRGTHTTTIFFPFFVTWIQSISIELSEKSCEFGKLSEAKYKTR